MKSLLPLVLGLLVFIGGHVIIRLPGMREKLRAQFGPKVYHALFSLWALMGLALIVHGFGFYRAQGYIPVWEPPRFLNHLAILLIWPAMILLFATYLPGRIKAAAKHPTLLAIKIWSSGHLLVNGDLGSILLFGSFLGWAVFTRIALKRSGSSEAMPGAPAMAGNARNDAIAVALGTGLTLLLVFWLHRVLIGVSILG